MNCIICNNDIVILHTLYEYCPRCFHIQKKDMISEHTSEHVDTGGHVVGDISLRYHCKFFKHVETNHIVRLLEINSMDNYSEFIKNVNLKNYGCYLEGINLDINENSYSYDILYINNIFGFTYTPHLVISHIKSLVKNDGRIFITTYLPNFILNFDSIYISNRLDMKSIFNTNSMKCLCSINNVHLNNVLYAPKVGKNCLYEISLQPIDVNYMNIYEVLYDEICQDLYLQDTYTNFVNVHS